MKDKERIKGIVEAILFTMGESVAPVSYTHLDVYKRQVVRSVGILCFANSMPRVFIREVLPPPPIKVKIWLSVRPRREERLWLKKFFFKIKLPCEKLIK